MAHDLKKGRKSVTVTFMRLSLLTKFFISFLITGAVLVAILISLIQFYAFQNFKDYVANTEYRQLDPLVPLLQAAFDKHQGWAFLEQNHSEWHALLYQAGLIHGPARPPGQKPPHPGAPGARRQGPLPPEFSENPIPPGPPHPMRDRTELGPRISLLDRNKALVMGRPLSENSRLRPIPDQNTPIGYLGFNTQANLFHPMDQAFLKQQKTSFFIAGALFLAVSVLVSFILAAHLLSPIQKLSKATRALGRRKFDTRIHLDTGDELGQLANDFNRMAVTLGDYEQRQIQWLSDISHELRTPLAILKGELEAVQDNVRSLDQAAMDSLHTEVSHLIRLVTDLHDLSVAEAEMMTLVTGPCDVATILAQVLDKFGPQFEARKAWVTAELEPGLMITGDPDRLTQLFSNLIKNALAYTDVPGIFEISCSADQGHALIIFEDSNPGVPQALLPRIFDRLFRADASRNRSHGGSGLGLAICRHIVIAHQGEISAGESRLGGIRITIRLPLNQQGETR